MLSSPSTLGTPIQSGSTRQGGGACRARFTATRNAAAARAASSWRAKRAEGWFFPPLPVSDREDRRVERRGPDGSWRIPADALSKALDGAARAAAAFLVAVNLARQAPPPCLVLPDWMGVP
ncbi:hypothetical protein B484DRAFT_408556, partial [Ochromonadaceae sp. CCMP2298]